MNPSSAVHFNPRVAIIAEEIPKKLLRYSENLILISPQGLDSAFVSQVIRIYMAGISEAQYAMTSDVDMLPLNPKVYEFGIRNVYNSNDFVVLRDVLPAGEFPICYNLASAKTWNQLFIDQKNKSSSEFLNRVNSKYNADDSYSGIHGGIGWSIDQRFLYDSVVDSGTAIQIKKFTDAQTGHRRLDRIHHRFPFNWLLLPFVVFGRFSDYHVHHPIQKNTFFVRALRYAVVLKGWKI
jgi:hypothetical protein